MNVTTHTANNKNKINLPDEARDWACTSINKKTIIVCWSVKLDSGENKNKQ